MHMSESGIVRLRLKIAIKCVVTTLLLWVAFRTVDIGAVSRLLSGLDPLWAASAVFLTALIVIFDAVLFVEVLRMFSRRMQFGTAMGVEAAGVIDAVGPSVNGFKAGDRVTYTGSPLGAYSTERVMIAPATIARIEKRRGQPAERIVAALIDAPRSTTAISSTSLALKSMPGFHRLPGTQVVRIAAPIKIASTSASIHVLPENTSSISAKAYPAAATSEQSTNPGRIRPKVRSDEALIGITIVMKRNASVRLRRR